jgi:ATP-dependent protease HslVU (ClpYQ) peptidase subunit
MYGDLQYTNNNTGGKWKGKTKVYPFNNPDIYPEPFIAGFSGSANDTITIVHYWTAPEKFTRPPAVKGCGGLVLTQSGDIFIFDNYTRWLKVEEPHAAIGSGQQIALGAMEAGATPKEAIKIASKKDSYTGFGVKGFNIG